jgi:hypothetical protein
MLKTDSVEMMAEKHFSTSPEQARDEMERAIEQGTLRQRKDSVGTHIPGPRIKGRTINERKLFIACFPKHTIDRNEIQTWLAEHAEYVMNAGEGCPRTGRTH